MFKNNQKLAAIAITAASLATFTASSASAKVRRLAPQDNCSVTSNSTNLYFNSSGLLWGTDLGYYTCGIPNDSYMTNTAIDKINVHLYNSTQQDSTVWARPCARDYNGDDTDCEAGKSTTTIGEVTLSWTGVSFEYSSYATYVYGYLYNGDFLRLIWVSE